MPDCTLTYCSNHCPRNSTGSTGFAAIVAAQPLAKVPPIIFLTYSVSAMGTPVAAAILSEFSCQLSNRYDSASKLVKYSQGKKIDGVGFSETLQADRAARLRLDPAWVGPTTDLGRNTMAHMQCMHSSFNGRVAAFRPQQPRLQSVRSGKPVIECKTSRIGKQPVPIPTGVTVTIKGTHVTVKVYKELAAQTRTLVCKAKPRQLVVNSRLGSQCWPIAGSKGTAREDFPRHV